MDGTKPQGWYDQCDDCGRRIARNEYKVKHEQPDGTTAVRCCRCEAAWQEERDVQRADKE